MKTKLLVLAGITFATLLFFVFLETQTVTPAWSQNVRNVQTTPKENISDDVSDLLSSMQGIQTEEVAYLDDDKAIYVSKPNDLNEKTSRRKIAENVEFVFDQRGGKVLFGKGDKHSPELWLTNSAFSSMKKTGSAVSRASFSPLNDKIAVYTLDGGLHLLNDDGSFFKKVGINGAMPLFSPDGRYLAYYKLANSSEDGNFQSLAEYAFGIAIYDIKTGKEKLVTTNSMDYEPVAFSADGTSLYFNSGRGQGLQSDYYKGEPFQTPLWSVNIASGKLQQLNNRGIDNSVVFVHNKSLVSSDNSVMISESSDGIVMLRFNEKGEVFSAQFLAEGTDPRWLKKDEIIAYRAQGVKGKYWEFISVK